MRLATVRLLHRMQGLERVSRTRSRKRKRGSLLSAHSTLKAADILENNVLPKKKKKLPVRGTGPILINGSQARISPRGNRGRVSPVTHYFRKNGTMETT